MLTLTALRGLLLYSQAYSALYVCRVQPCCACHLYLMVILTFSVSRGT